MKHFTNRFCLGIGSGLIIALCLLISNKQVFEIQDVLSPNPMAPWGVRFIDRDIKQNKTTIKKMIDQE